VYAAVLLTLAALSPRPFTFGESPQASQTPLLRAVACSNVALVAKERGNPFPTACAAALVIETIVVAAEGTLGAHVRGAEPSRAIAILLHTNGSRAPPLVLSLHST
jgi:hypothetical protein